MRLDDIQAAADARSHHFAAFSFVDRIVHLEPGVRATGLYTVPAALEEFPASLVAEAIGQLAAWVSMAKIDFSGRPVAALAGETRFMAPAVPGTTIELRVEIESCDQAAVAYGGSAQVNDKSLLTLARCLGPMLPASDFDDPDALRARFDLLRGEGARGGAFAGVAAPPVTEIDSDADGSISAELAVPEAAPFFADHFPRRAVFPATLLLNEQMKLARSLLRRLPASAATNFAPVLMSDVKMRSFIEPGQRVLIGATVKSLDENGATLALTARLGERTLSTSRLEFLPAEQGDG